jgi:cell division protease FtsH
MFDELTAALGGRASEHVNFGKISTGALNDLEKVTKQAFNMVAYFGLNDKIGNISYYDSTGQQEYSFQKPYSEKTAQIIDQELSLLVEKAYQRAIEIIKENKSKVEKLASLLLEKEVIFREDLVSIFGERPFDEQKKLIEKAAEEEVQKLKDSNNKSKKAKKELSENAESSGQTDTEIQELENIAEANPDPTIKK